MTDTPEQNESALLREELTPDQRVAPMRFGIDPGFVHFRLIENLLGPGGMKAINQQIAD